MTNTQKQKKTAAVHRRKLLLAGIFAFVAVIFALVQVNRRPTFAAPVPTEYPTGRQCFDVNQKALSAAAITAITDHYYKMGNWVFFNTETKAIEQPKKPGSKGAFYWQPRKDAVIDQTVYCVEGFCQYGTDYCTNWSSTLKAIVKTQQEMRCYQSKDVNQVWNGWIDAQGIAKPTDPGTTITLEPNLTCSKHDVKEPGDWETIDAPKDVPLPPAPPVSASQSSAATTSSVGTQVVSGSANIKASLLDLTKKSKKKATIQAAGTKAVSGSATVKRSLIDVLKKHKKQ